jgi:hypothetical protein
MAVLSLDRILSYPLNTKVWRYGHYANIMPKIDEQSLVTSKL